MKVSSCNTKNILEFLGMNPCTSQPKPKKPKKFKPKKFTPPKNSLHFWKWKCIPLFSQKKSISYISRNGTLHFSAES